MKARQNRLPETSRLLMLSALTIGVACSATEPSRPTATPDAFSNPASSAVPASATEPALPAVMLSPRRAWRPIPIDRRSGSAQAFAASPVENRPDGLRRGWIVLNLSSPIPLPETGGHARSVAFLADYRCDDRAWHPMETVWYSQRHATAEVLRERPRRPDQLGAVQTGTLVDVFLRAVCRS